MHAAHEKLTYDSFRGSDPAWFPAGDHDEALSRMLYLIERGYRCGMVCGASGSGKTRTLQEIGRHISKAGTAVRRLDLTGFSRADFVITLANACGAGLKSTASASAAWSFLEDWLAGRVALNGRAVWLLDEVDAAAESVALDILRLARLAARHGVMNSIILTVERPGLAQPLADFSDFMVTLSPWSTDESREFITMQLQAAGKPESLLDDEAWDELLHAGQGNPQRLLRITAITLAAGEALGVSRLSSDLLSAVIHQLGWQPSAANMAWA